MGVVGRILGTIAEYTKHLDEEVDKGFDLRKWGDLMKFLHGLQVQSQMLIDLFQRASSLLGYAPSFYIEAGEILLKEGIISEEDFKFFRSVVGFRNIVVHEYFSINLNIVNKILRKREYRRILHLANKVYNTLREKGLDP